MRILVTGGAGFIGSHIVEHFQRKAEIRVLDNLRSGSRRNLIGFAHEFIEGSITDRDAVRAAMHGVDYVFHLAAMISVPESMEKPVECVEINTIGTLVVLEEAAKAGVKKLCFSSSSAIYGSNADGQNVETMRPEPLSPYAVTKLDGEFYCEIFQRDRRLETASLRYFNVFGPRQNPNGPYAAAVPIFVECALAGIPITIFGDGEQTRDFISVKDVVAANVHLAQTAELTGVFNVARGRGVTITELAQKVIAAANSRSPIIYASERVGDVRHSTASVEKLRCRGFSAIGNFDKALGETVDELRSRER